ncbi:MAG: hypothetical protein IKT22_04005 [Prevotella sp.]|nr:hypothetical protein [Prevotella sp.]
MNQNMEQEFDKLLSSLAKKEYPLKKWMEEDETETFDSIVSKRKRDRSIRRWIAVAACLVVLVGFATVAKLSQRQQQAQLPQPVVAKVEPIPKQEEIIQVQVPTEKPSHPVEARKSKPSRRQTPKTSPKELPTEKTEVDIAEEMADLIACIDGFEQQLLSE